MWRRVIELDPSTRQPLCPSSGGSSCPAQAQAYVTARDLMRGPAFANVTVTSTMQPDTHDLAFKAGDVIGKLRIAPKAEYAKTFPEPDDFARAIVAGIDRACRERGSNPGDAWGFSEGILARRGTTCRPRAGAPSRSIVLVWSTGPSFRVFSLLDNGPLPDAGKMLADSIASSIEKLSR